MRALSSPLVTRRGWGEPVGESSACTSVTSGRRPSTVTVTAVGTLGAILAANSGEALEEAVRDRSVRELVRDHVEAGDMARGAAIVFLIVMLVVVFAPRFVKSIAAKKWWRPVVIVAVVASGAFSSWAMYDAGHSGAKSVWNEVKVTGEGEGD